MHSLPPYFGAGSLHKRFRIWEPLPQVRVHVSHGDQGPQLPLTKGDKKKSWFIFVLFVQNTTRNWISIQWNNGGTHSGMETSDTSRFAVPRPHSPFLRAEGWGSCRGGYGWWHQHRRWQSRKTRVTSGSSCRPAWLNVTKKGQRSVIRKQSIGPLCPIDDDM